MCLNLSVCDCAPWKIKKPLTRQQQKKKVINKITDGLRNFQFKMHIECDGGKKKGHKQKLANHLGVFDEVIIVIAIGKKKEGSI